MSRPARYPVRLKRLSEQQNHRCCYCGVRFGEGQTMATTEHVVAWANGGSNEWPNVVAACLRCNNMRDCRNAYKFFAQRLWERETRTELGRIDPDYLPAPRKAETLAAIWPRQVHA